MGDAHNYKNPSLFAPLLSKVASFLGPRPAPRRLQYRTTSDGKLGEGLGTRLCQKRMTNKCNTTIFRSPKTRLQKHPCRFKKLLNYCFLLRPQAFIAQFVDRNSRSRCTCPLFLTVSHKYGISYDNDVLISSANIPAELHVVVCLFTRPSLLFSLSNFPTGCGRGGSGDETSCS